MATTDIALPPTHGDALESPPYSESFIRRGSAGNIVERRLRTPGRRRDSLTQSDDIASQLQRMQTTLSPAVDTQLTSLEDSTYLFRLYYPLSLSDVPTDESARRAWNYQALRQVAGALESMHSQGFSHGNVSPRNVMLDADRNAFLVDPLVHRHMHYNVDPDDSVKIPHCWRYLSPEDLLCDDTASLSEKDVYAFGTMAYELVSGIKLYPRASGHKMYGYIYNRIEKGDGFEQGDLEDWFWDLVQACRKQPGERCSMAHVVAIMGHFA